jgi:hypothetical protein
MPWDGPSRIETQVLCMLYASLIASLLSAFLAMFGKRWLNRYALVNMRGSAIERSQNRQRKLDEIGVWYFDHMLESLQPMLHVALLLLGWALSLQLWEIDITVASVVTAVTLFGVLIYLSIIVAGGTSESYPSQTPWTTIISRLFAKHSALYGVLFQNRDVDKYGITVAILTYPLVLLSALVTDAFRLGRATFRSLVASVYEARRWSFGTPPIPKHALSYRTTELDFRCISWMLQDIIGENYQLVDSQLPRISSRTPWLRLRCRCGLFQHVQQLLCCR